MENACCCLRVGDVVPDFTVKTFEPSKGGFGEFNLKKQMGLKRWVILFFYPADFTFV